MEGPSQEAGAPEGEPAVLYLHSHACHCKASPCSVQESGSAHDHAIIST